MDDEVRSRSLKLNVSIDNLKECTAQIMAQVAALAKVRRTGTKTSAVPAVLAVPSSGLRMCTDVVSGAAAWNIIWKRGWGSWEVTEVWNLCPVLSVLSLALLTSIFFFLDLIEKLLRSRGTNEVPSCSRYTTKITWQKKSPTGLSFACGAPRDHTHLPPVERTRLTTVTSMSCRSLFACRTMSFSLSRWV